MSQTNMCANMKCLVKCGAVLAGYMIAVIAASAAVAVRVANTQGLDAQASAGMYAFGDLILFLGVFGILALFPTGLALYFLRRFERFWTVFSAAALAFSVTGLCAALVIAIASTQPSRSAWGVLAAIGFWRMLIAPLLALAFVLSTFIASIRCARLTLLGATLIEGATGTYTLIFWFVRPFLNNLFYGG